MSVWKKYLAPTLFTFSSVLFLLVAVAGWVIEGRPIRTTLLVFSLSYFAIAVGLFVAGQKSVSGSGPASV